MTLFPGRQLFVLAVAVWAVPACSAETLQVVSAATYSSNAIIAQGSFFAVLGSGLGSDALAPEPTSETGLPTMLPANSGTSVVVTDSAGKTSNCLLRFVSPSQIDAVMPSTVAVGPARVTVSVNGEVVGSGNITIAQEQFGVFYENGQGWGQAVAQNISTAAGFAANNLTTPANPGQSVILYGTGLGPLPAQMDDSKPAAADVNFLAPPYNYSVTVWVNGEAVPSSFAGRAQGGFPALDQIDFKLPADVAEGCFVRGEVQVTVPGSPASGPGTFSSFTIATAAPGQSCPNLFGLDAAGLQTLQSGQTVNVGVGIVGGLNVVNDMNDPQPGSVAGMFFVTANKPGIVALNDVLALFGVASGAIWDPSLALPPGKCSVFDANTFLQIPSNILGALDANLGSGPVIATGSIQSSLQGAVVSPLSVGSQLTLAGPGGQFALTPSSDGPGQYETNPAPGAFTSGGTWILSGPGQGSEGAGAFSISFTMPPEVHWTNAPASGVISRSENLPVRFTAAGTTQVSIGGAALETSDSSISGTVFACAAQASAGQFTIPESVLQQLPALSTGNAGLAVMSVTAQGLAPFASFTGLDGGAVFYMNGTAIEATWQ